MLSSTPLVLGIHLSEVDDVNAADYSHLSKQLLDGSRSTLTQSGERRGLDLILVAFSFCAHEACRRLRFPYFNLHCSSFQLYLQKYCAFVL